MVTGILESEGLKRKSNYEVGLAESRIVRGARLAKRAALGIGFVA